jgi:hypothetical protein
MAWHRSTAGAGRRSADFVAEVGNIACEAAALIVLSRGRPPQF